MFRNFRKFEFDNFRFQMKASIFLRSKMNFIKNHLNIKIKFIKIHHLDIVNLSMSNERKIMSNMSKNPQVMMNNR